MQFLIGNIATFFTIIGFFFGCEICSKIWSKRNTRDISAAPFMIGIISISLWLKYGIDTNDKTIINVNLVGFIIYLIYNIFYYLMSLNKSSISKQYLVIIVIFFSFWYLPSYFENVIKIRGLIASFFNILFFASPLMQINTVFKTKSSDSLPISLIVISLISSVFWLFFGLLTNNLFIQVPNYLAILILTFQIIIYIFYFNSKKNHQGLLKKLIDDI